MNRRVSRSTTGLRAALAAGVFAALGAQGCGPVSDDTGAADPVGVWPWICDDGGLAPESGCPSTPSCGSDDGDIDSCP